ncbi:hypothetical protein HLH07_04420 [Lactobacillus crispatus]|uniref:hypothetical protein n=1 Tax=Lactobacillus crispatus TaxID=47770 RepID=UPI0018C2E632|nr:hypothetical protein [Lactobacillus crispatus]MBG0734114.1 hypothetical protein [Lactobacillus crispatus]
MPSGVAVIFVGIFGSGTICQPAGTFGVTGISSSVFPVNGVVPTSLPFGSTYVIFPVCSVGV